MTVLAGHSPFAVSGAPFTDQSVVTRPCTTRAQFQDHEPASGVQRQLEHLGSLIVDRRFAVVPEWVIDAPVSDAAFRLYAVLLRYGQSSGVRMPGRATLARRLRKKSVDTVDRALKELVDAGAVRIEHRHAGKQRLSNLYHVITDSPGSRTPPSGGGSRSQAATPPAAGDPPGPVSSNETIGSDSHGRTPAATRSRRVAAGVAAPMRHDPGAPTQSILPPTSPHPVALSGRGERGGTIADEKQQQLLAACGIPDLDALAAHSQQLRQAAGKPAARWTAQQLLTVLDRAVTIDGWPAAAAVPALLAVAADPATASPMRLTAPGPWWDLPRRPAAAALTADEQQELDQHTAELERLPDSGVGARHTARAQLAAEKQPWTRLTIARRAVDLMQKQTGTAP